MATLQDVLNNIDVYKTKYRKEDLPQLEISGIYALFPNDGNRNEIKYDMKWPDTWPNVERQGIYFNFWRKS